MADPTDVDGPVQGNDSQDDSDVPDPLVHLYRGEIERVTSWRGRLDQTINWAVTILAVLLTWVFSSPDNPHYLLLIGMGAIIVFHLVETRRYRAYDVWRSRVRLLEEDVFAAALDPATGPEHATWQEKLSTDLRKPALKTPFFEAYVRRLRRMYLPLLLVLLAAWLARITVFTPKKGIEQSAAMVGIPGRVILVGIGLAYLAIIAVAVWPIDRQAKGELYEQDKEGEWK